MRKLRVLICWCLILGMCHVTYSINFMEVKTNLTTTEKLALETFRPLVKDVLYRDYMYEDYYLVTFLREKEMKLKDASDMIRTAHKWRRDNRIDTVLFEDMTKLQKAFPCYTDGFDYEGRPIITWDFGRWDIRKMSVSGSMPLLVRYVDRILEEAVTKVRQQRVKTQKDVTQYVIIIDGYGFGLRTHGCISCLPFYYAFITHTDLYYPLSGHAVHMINVPKVFENVLALIRPIMSANTKDLIKIYGYDSSEWKKVFTKTIPLDQIRKQFGGVKENKI